MNTLSQRLISLPAGSYCVEKKADGSWAVSSSKKRVEFTGGTLGVALDNYQRQSMKRNDEYVPPVADSFDVLFRELPVCDYNLRKKFDAEDAWDISRIGTSYEDDTLFSCTLEEGLNYLINLPAQD